MRNRFLRVVLSLPILIVAGAAAAQNLPPGIEKKLEAGKELPPGIEKKFDESRPLPPGIGGGATKSPAVPEPGAIALFATGMALYAATIRRRDA